jgi:hypothetical protein
MGLNFWGPGDEWFDVETGIEVDIVYFDTQWMEDQIRRVVLDHQASMGYGTCFWYTVRGSQIFYDPNAWFAGLQKICQQPYPEPLRYNIITHNYPVLREIIPSYFFQIEKAVKRCDLVSVNHRLAGLLAGYFDIIFALNRELHPGEKRLVEKAVASCQKLPENMETEINAVLTSTAVGDARLLDHLATLLDHLDRLLLQEGFEILLPFWGKYQPEMNGDQQGYLSILFISGKKFKSALKKLPIREEWGYMWVLCTHIYPLNSRSVSFVSGVISPITHRIYQRALNLCQGYCTKPFSEM